MEIYEIGFNDQVAVGERGFHVQTEILGKVELKIKTTVLEGGTVKHVATRLGSATAGVDAIKEIASSQHQEILHKVLHSDID